MSTLAIEIREPRAEEVTIRDDDLVVRLTDGRTISAPLAWYPRLWHGTEQERAHFEIIGDGGYIHWPDLDEDLTVSGILAGRPSAESPASLKEWLATRSVLDAIPAKGSGQQRPLLDPEGLWAGKGPDVSSEEIAEARREMWGKT